MLARLVKNQKKAASFIETAFFMIFIFSKSAVTGEQKLFAQ
jgi:hypothetical protein